ncbi:maleylpyruvate isomerase family mycothiol-dependent enzyme, partial [Pimelobacter simplex]|uniref:maleylpyruvate isomerase family mycothiol-dependent enzyme n=1 Tax=Nocardioides simplex TaxID=2045 RepID=UPI001EFB2655
MTTSTTTGAVRRSALDRRTAMTLAAEEYRRFAAALERLDAADWERPTDCPAWDVRQVAAHVVGMEAMAAGIREGARQRRGAPP